MESVGRTFEYKLVEIHYRFHLLILVFVTLWLQLSVRLYICDWNANWGLQGKWSSCFMEPMKSRLYVNPHILPYCLGSCSPHYCILQSRSVINYYFFNNGLCKVSWSLGHNKYALYTCVHLYLFIMCCIKHVGSGNSIIFVAWFIVTLGSQRN